MYFEVCLSIDLPIIYQSVYGRYLRSEAAVNNKKLCVDPCRTDPTQKTLTYSSRLMHKERKKNGSAPHGNH